MESVTAIVITPDGNASVEEIKGDLSSIQSLLDGGWLEAVTPMVDTGYGPWHGYVDEEGKLKGLPRNYVADDILTGLGWGGRVGGDFIVGPLVLLGDSPDGEEAPVPGPTLRYVLDFYRARGTLDLTSE